jgi:hypothetical protein
MRNTGIRNLLFLTMMLFSFVVYAQKTRTNVSGGYGFYQLNSYKEFQNLLVTNGIPFEGIKAMDTFPNYFNWMIAQEFIFNPYHSASLEFSYLYTGGRNHLADYSGNYSLNMRASSYRLGLSYSNYSKGLFGRSRLRGFLRLRAGMTRSYFGLNEKIDIYEVDQQSIDINFFSNSVYMEFGPGLVYELTPNLSLHFAAGYELERDAKLKGIENKNLILINQNNSYVRTNWSGFRLHAGIGFKPGSLPFLRRAPGVTN